MTAAKEINSRAVSLRSVSSAIPFMTLFSNLNSMRDSYVSGIQPLLSMGNAAAINPVITAFFAGSVPVNPYTALQAVGTTLLTFYTAYDVVFDSLTPINFEPATGHTYADIQLAQLASLADELDAVIAATAALI
jgi:hypothetical protein